MEISCSNQVKTKACRLPKIRHSVTEKEPWGAGREGDRLQKFKSIQMNANSTANKARARRLK